MSDFPDRRDETLSEEDLEQEQKPTDPNQDPPEDDTDLPQPAGPGVS